ncbi:MAG: hypothetical protein KA275_07565 [Chitinophagaceae bacterium]|nr:hypothetical protein [Chitinophagaceae bacterium]
MKINFQNFLVIFLFSAVQIQAQKIEISSGINRNQFFSFQKSEGHQRHNFTSNFGYSIGASFYNYTIDSMQHRVSIRLDNYKGKFYSTSGALGGSSSTEAEVEKTTIGIAYYPIIFNVVKKLQLNLGGEFSTLINSKTIGYKTYSGLVYINNKSQIIENDSFKINSKNYWAINCLFVYDIKINKYWILTPQLNLHLGVTNDFKNVEANIKSFRQSALIGIVRNLNQK